MYMCLLWQQICMFTVLNVSPVGKAQGQQPTTIIIALGMAAGHDDTRQP